MNHRLNVSSSRTACFDDPENLDLSVVDNQCTGFVTVLMSTRLLLLLIDVQADILQIKSR